MFAALLALALSGQQPSDSRIRAMLARVAEEAEVFRQKAPRLLAQETLRQRALEVPRRFRPRVGKAAAEPPKPEYRTRQIISEYTFGYFRDSPGVLHEFRQMTSVDGRELLAPTRAREKLALGLQSADDRSKRRMLEEFERHGLRAAAAGFGQAILLFSRPRLVQYAFTWEGHARVGAVPAVILRFRQSGGQGALTIFEGRRMLRAALAGQLWLRDPDGLPLRIVLEATRQQDGQTVRDQATVEYIMSPHGVLVPASVLRRHFVGDVLTVEDVFQYSPFRLFAADAEVKFP